MRLLYVHGNRADSQAANVVQVFNMCQAFANCGVEVTLAVARSENERTDPHDVAAVLLGQDPNFEIVTYRNYTVRSRFNVLGKYFGVRRILKQYRDDLCCVRDPLSLHLAIRAGLPTVFEAHASQLHNRSRALGWLWRRDLLANTKDVNLLRFVTISHALADFWSQSGVPNQKIITLHDGFNPSLFGNGTSQSQARHMLDLPLSRKIVVYTGSLKPDRGISRILRLAEAFKEALFVVVGGTEKQRLHYEEVSKTENETNVRWEGHVPHAAVSNYLQAADVLLMLWTWDVPTISICSPLKVFEYMASARVIVGEAFPTIGEVLTDGETALLAEPESFEDLRLKLGHALTLEYPSSMAREAHDLAFKKYTWTIRAHMLLESLEGML